MEGHSAAVIGGRDSILRELRGGGCKAMIPRVAFQEDFHFMPVDLYKPYQAPAVLGRRDRSMTLKPGLSGRIMAAI